MSHAKNKVRWCLKKAKEEIKEGNNHRGLIECISNINLAKEFLAKAEHNLFASISNKEQDFRDWAVSAAFYSVYHCLLAIITKEGYQSRNQERTFALITLLIEEKKITLSEEVLITLKSLELKNSSQNILSLREDLQYSTKTRISEKRLVHLIALCKEVLSQTKEIINSSKAHNATQ